MVNINHKQRIGQAAHIFYTADRTIELVFAATTHQRFFLGELRKGTVLLLRLKITQALNRRADGLVVGQHTAEPAVADVWHTATCGVLFNDFAGSALGANEHDLVFVLSQPTNETQSVIERRDSVLEVDDVDFVACSENVLIHLRIPETSLVAKVRAGLQQLAHAYLCHNFSLSWVYLPLSQDVQPVSQHPASCAQRACLLTPVIYGSGAFYTTGDTRPEAFRCNICPGVR